MSDWHLILGIISGIIAFSSIFPYLKDILHGTTRPNLVSYILWGLLLTISSLAQISGGTSWSILFLLGDLLSVMLVVILCLMGYGYGKYGRLEFVCTILTIIAIILWQITGEPLLAIIFALIADLIASIPTIVKTYRDPLSEIPTAWFMIAFAGILAIISSTIFDPINLLSPIYIILINSTVGTIALVGRRSKQLRF